MSLQMIEIPRAEYLNFLIDVIDARKSYGNKRDYYVAEAADKADELRERYFKKDPPTRTGGET